MDRADPGRVDGTRVLGLAELPEPPPDPLAQLGRGLVGERQREDRADGDAVVEHRLGEALDHDRGLARAGAGGEQRRPAAVGDRRALLARRADHAGASVRGSPARQMPGKRQPRLEQRSGHGSSRPACRSAAVRAASSRASSSATRERVAVDDVGPRVGAGHVVADEPARAELAARERLVEPGDRLVAEQVADGEQVERDLELELVGPLHAADDGAALVVAHDRGAAGADVDPVDAAGHHAAVAAERERPVGVVRAAERPLELGRLVAGAALGLRAQVALEVGLEAAQHDAAARGLRAARPLGEALPERVERGVEPLRHDPRGAGALAQQLERALEHRVRERAAPHRLRVGLGAARAQELLDQPAHAAAGERLEPARRLGLARGEQPEHRGRRRRAQRRRLGRGFALPRRRAAARAASARPAVPRSRPRAAACRAAPRDPR